VIVLIALFELEDFRPTNCLL